LSAFARVVQAHLHMKRLVLSILTAWLMLHATRAKAQAPAPSTEEQFEWRKQTLSCVSFLMGFPAAGTSWSR
jgi:hypothetical protein